MRNTKISKSKLARFGRPALAAAVLAFAASASFAGAVVSISSFTAMGSGPTDADPLAVQTYVLGSGQSSSMSLTATNGNGASQSKFYPDAANPGWGSGDWGPSATVTAQTSAAVASGNIVYVSIGAADSGELRSLDPATGDDWVLASLPDLPVGLDFSVSASGDRIVLAHVAADDTDLATFKLERAMTAAKP
jgi:hypothetical protein